MLPRLYRNPNKKDSYSGHDFWSGAASRISTLPSAACWREPAQVHGQHHERLEVSIRPACCLLLSELPKKAPSSSTNTSLFYVSDPITRMWPKVMPRFGLRPQIPSYMLSSFNYQLDTTWSIWEENLNGVLSVLLWAVGKSVGDCFN